MRNGSGHHDRALDVRRRRTRRADVERALPHGARRSEVLQPVDQRHGHRREPQHADDVIFIPKTLEQTEPILQAIVMQLFAYYMTVKKGLDVDRPRNLVKSVSVE